MCVPLQKTVKQKFVRVCVQICSTCAYLNVFFYFVCVSLSMCVLCLWNAFKSARKCLGVFQVREFPCSLTRCDSYNWVPFDFCRPAPQPPLPPLLPPSPPLFLFLLLSSGEDSWVSAVVTCGCCHSLPSAVCPLILTRLSCPPFFLNWISFCFKLGTKTKPSG